MRVFIYILISNVMDEGDSFLSLLFMIRMTSDFN